MKKLTENFSIKLLSLGIAFILWIFITNLINPMVSGFVNVPITLENEDYILEQNKTYVVKDSRVVKINYLVKSNEQTRVRQSDFKVTVDLKDLDVTTNLPVHVTALNDIDNFISNYSAEPDHLHVELDDVSRNEYVVGYEIKGDAGAGHSVGNVILSPSVVYITGSNAAIDSIGNISIEIPLTDQEEIFSGVAKVRVYDKGGNALSTAGLALSAEEISYTVVLNSRANIVLNAVVEGNVKPGYTYAGAQVVPSNIMINGPKSAVQNMYMQDLPTINIDELDENTEYTFKTSEILPKGITSSTDIIKVIITINESPMPSPMRDGGFGPRRENENIGESGSNVISMPTTTAQSEEYESVEGEIVESSNVIDITESAAGSGTE